MQMALATGGTPGAPAAHVHYRAPMTIPANVDEILALMATKETDLSQRIASGTLITLYQPALDIKDLVAALAQGDRALDVRRAGKLKLLVGAVNRTVDKIDRAGDTGDGARARSVAQELSGHLNEIRRIFAPGA
jgi:hypothetical protein